MNRLSSVALVLMAVLAVAPAGPAAAQTDAASITAFPGTFVPGATSMDGRLVLGNGVPAGQPAAPAYRWAAGQWQPLAYVVGPAALTGADYLSGNRTVVRLSPQGAASVQTLVGGGASSISPDGRTIAGLGEGCRHPTILINGFCGLVWSGGSYPSVLAIPSDGECTIQRNFWEDPPIATAAGIFGDTAHHECGSGTPSVRIHYTGWPGGILGDFTPTLVTPDGRTHFSYGSRNGAPPRFFYYIGRAAYTPPPAGCAINTFSFDGSVAGGAACVWRFDWGWTPILDLLADQGVDVTGWSGVVVNAYSGDGRVAVGRATRNGQTVGFRAVLGRKPMRVEVRHDPIAADIGQPFTTTVEVTNLTDAPIADVTPTILTPPPGGPSATVVSGPTPASVGSLAPGATATFTVGMEAAGRRGNAEVVAVVTADGAGGAALRARGRRFVGVTETALATRLVVVDGVVNVGDAFVLRLTVTNTTDETLTAVGPASVMDLRLRQGAQATPLQAPPLGTGVTLVPDASTVFEYVFQAVAAGPVDAEVRVRATGADGTPVQSETAEAAFRIRPPDALRATLRVEPVTPGDGRTVDGVFILPVFRNFRAILRVENAGYRRITGVAPPAELPESGTGLAVLNEGPTPAGPVALEAGQAAEFVYRFGAADAGGLSYATRVGGLNPEGEAVESNEATAAMAVTDLVVTVRLSNRTGEVAEAPAGRRRFVNGFGDWVTTQRYFSVEAGDQVCNSGCVDVEVTVEDVAGEPVEGAAVTLSRTSVAGAVPEMGGGFFCTNDADLQDCAVELVADATDAAGLSRSVYWFPGLLDPAATTIRAAVETENDETGVETAALALVPTEVDFGPGTVQMTQADILGSGIEIGPVLIGDGGLSALEAMRLTGEIGETVVTGGCKAAGEFLSSKSPVPLDFRFLKAGKAAIDLGCGTLIERLANPNTPAGDRLALVTLALSTVKKGAELAEMAWFLNSLGLHDDGIAEVTLESPAPPFIAFQSEFRDFILGSMREMYLAEWSSGQPSQITLDIREVSAHQLAGSAAEDVPALHLRLRTARGIDRQAVVRLGYSPNDWLAASNISTTDVAAPAVAGSPSLSVGPGNRTAGGEATRGGGAPYATGHVVTIDYGLPTAERVQVASVSGNTLALTTPLRFAHGVGATVARTDSLGVGVPDAPTAVGRAAGVPGEALTPTLAWGTRAPAATYDVEVAADSLFATLLETRAGLAAESVVAGPLAAPAYWRVRASNLLGTGPWSRTYALRPGAAASDALAGAAPLAGEAAQWTLGATTELAEVAPSCGSAVNSLWFTWTAPATGRFVARTDLSTFAAAVSVWTGAAHPLVEVACGGPPDPYDITPEAASAEFQAEAGTAYRVRVAGASAAEGLAFVSVVPAAASANTFVVTTTADSGPGSFRQALSDFRLTNRAGRIAFAIPGAGPHVIRPVAALPIPGFELLIDGFTQPGSRPNTAGPWQPTNAVHRVVLDGSLAGTNGIGLVLRGSGSVVRGLQIVRFATHGVILNGGRDMAVEGCVIGTDDAGAAGLGNGFSGVWVDRSTAARIGGANPAARNVLAGNANYGVLVLGTEASGTRVEGNWIGVTPTGTAARPNAFGGIYGGNATALGGTATASTAADLRVGGTTAGAGNLISGNGGFGVLFNGQAANVATVTLGDTRVEGNRIGTNAAGTAAVGNTTGGVAVRRNATGITIGGGEPGAGNLLSGNLDGVFLEVSTAVVVEGNLVGTTAAGTGLVPNTRSGIFLACADDAVVRGNVVGGSPAGGVGLSCAFAAFPGSGNRIVGNWIGTDRSGTADLGNASGVVVGQRHGGEWVGGPLAADGNTIAFNDGPGVLVRASTTGPVSVRHNRLYANAGIAVDLEPAGTTANDPGDGDTGPNGLQNTPVLVVATGNGVSTLSVTYSVDTAPANAAYPLTIDFYLADPDGQEGRIWIGADTLVSAGAQAPRTASFTPAAPVASGSLVVATVTDAAGRTSEASANVGVSGSAGGATSLVVSGGPGWRMLALPLAGSTVGTLASQNLVQGLPDLYPGAGANLYTGFDGVAFTVPAGTSAPVIPGRGFLWYLYDLDLEPGGPSTSHALPVTLTVAGPPPSAEVVVPLHSVGQGWNLVGNPYPFALSLSDLPAWAEDGALRSAVAQTWDPSAGATGSYVLSSLTGDVIPAWTGAFVQNRDAARLRVPSTADAARTAARGDSVAVHRLAFELTGADAAGATLVDRSLAIVFRDGAGGGWDLWDAEKLGSLGSPSVEAAFAGERDGEPVGRAQASFRATPDAVVEVPLSVESVGASSSLVLTWPRVEVPDGWALSLVDLETGAVVDLRTETEYAFEVEPAAPERPAHDERVDGLPALAGKQVGQLSDLHVPTVARRRGVPTRFTVRIEPRGATATESGVPREFALGRPAPNPARGPVTFAVDVPTTADVRVIVYDALGREVLVLTDGERPAGRHAVRLDADRLAAGVYIVRMTSGGFVGMTRLTVVR